jgi:hypothetical protein
MFYHLLYIHLFRPFLKYDPATSPLQPHVSPRKQCIAGAEAISKLMRLYKRTYGLRQICNIAVYMVHSACTIHLLHLPDKKASRDIVHGVKHLEEIAEDWLCARRTLSILSVLARKWKIRLPEEASSVLARTDTRFGTFSTADVPSPKSDVSGTSVMGTPHSGMGAPSPKNLNLNPMSMGRANPVSGQHYVAGGAQYIGGSPGMANAIGVAGVSGRIPVSTSAAAAAGNYFPPVPASLPQDHNNSPSSLVSPFPRHQQQFTVADSTSPNNYQPQASSAMTISSAPSPNTIFGGIDALVESQNWWLRDQAALAVGFENWGSGSMGSLDGADGNGGNGTGGANMGGYYVGDGEWKYQ